MNYQQIDAERIRKVKQIRNTIGNNSGSQGYSQTALSALAKGQYSNLRNKSQSNDIPKLNGMSPVSVRVNNVQKNDSAIDTNRARQAYAKELGYKPTGRALSSKDSDLVHDAIGNFGTRRDDGSFSENSLRNVALSLGWQPNKEDEFKKKYGKSTLEVVKSEAKDWDKVEERKKKTFGEEHPILSTIESLTAEGIIKPLTGLASMTANMISPDSEITKAISNKSRGVSVGDTNLRSGVTNNMGDIGKTVYNAGVDVGGRIIGNQLLTPAASGFRTAEQARQSLEDRGITGRKAALEAAGMGAIDAALDVYGLEKIKGIKALQGSGNLAKTILGSAIAGGGEQALTGLFNEAIDRIANGKDSIYSQNMQNYLAMGMSEEDAVDAALTDEVKSIAQQAGEGALFGAAMGGGGQALRRGANAISNAVGSRIPALDGTVYFDGQRFITKDNDGFIVDDESGSYRVDNIDQAIRLIDDMKKGNSPSLQRVDVNSADVTPRETGVPEVDNAIRQAEEAAAEVERLRQQIPEVEEPKQEVKQEVKQEPKDYRIETVNRKGGKKGYYVAEFEDTTSKNAEPGKVYKTEAEAQEALKRLQSGEETSVEVNPEDVIYHSGKLSRLNKAESAGKMEGSRDTGYFGTGHYFVDQAHKSNIGEGTGYGDKPYSSVDISKYDNLFRADTDSKANKLHDFSQNFMRFINGRNKRYYTENGEVVPERLNEYIDDMYSSYKELFGDKAMSREDFVTRLNQFRDDYDYDFSDRSDSAFTTFMKEHGFNGVDSRGTGSAGTDRGVVIYDLDEDSVLQSNVTDKETKNGLMNTRVRNGNPVFDEEIDARLQKEIESSNKRKQIKKEYKTLYDESKLKSLKKQIEDAEEEVSNLDNDAIRYYQRILDDDEFVEKEARDLNRQFEQFGLPGEDIETLIRDKRNSARTGLEEAKADSELAKKKLADLQSELEAEEAKSKAAYEKAKAKVENKQPKTAEKTKTVTESAPENPKTTKEVPKVENADTENPRYKAPLEGKALEKAKKTIADNKASIEAEKGAIKLLKENKSNYRNNKLKKAVEEDIKNREAKIKGWEDKNKATRKRMKGGVTPVKELIDKELHDNIYNAMKKSGSIYKDINYATKFAGNTQEAKDIASELRTALNNYIENPTTDNKEIKAHFDKIISKAIQLDELARKSNTEYAKSHHNDYFGQSESGDQYGLAEAILMNGSLNKIRDFHKSLDIQTQATEKPASTEVPKVKQEPPKPSVPKVEATQQPKQSVPQVGQTPPKKPVTNTQPTGPETSISKRYETLKNSDLFKKSKANMKMLETAKEKGVFNKDIEYREKAQQEALDEYVKDPEKTIENNLNKQWDSGKDVDTSMLILHDALDSESQAYTNLVLLKQAQQAKKAGRQLRAYRDYTGTKEDTLQKAGQYLNDKADDILSSKKQREKIEKAAQGVTEGNVKTLAEKFGMDEASVKSIKDALGNGATKEDIAKMIAMYQATGKTGVSPDALKKVKEIYDKIEKGNLKPNSKARAELEADAFKVLAGDIGGKRTLKEQWDSWRYLAMLGNPKTHLRNILGNTTHRMVTEAKDNVGAVLEEAVDKINKKAGKQGIERTKSLLNTKKDAGLINKAAQDADNAAYGALNDMGNKYNVKTEIDRARNSFNNKLLSKIDDLNSNALDVEDYSALKKKYSRSLARYLKANGADESIFDATDDASVKLLDKARDYAIDQAKQATFHEYSQLADALTKFSTNLRKGNAVSKVGGAVVEGLVPFKKTPINILKQGIKYSPVSLAKAVSTTMNAVKTGNKTAADAIEDLASGLTGTGIMALGAGLAKLGFLTGAANPDYDVDTAETEQGAQNYALKIGNKSYTLDWLAPASLPLFVGKELLDLNTNDDNEEKDASDIALEALSTIAEPITEMSMLQGIQNILNELSYSTENVLATFASNATLGYASQAIPTLAGQIARSMDDTRRSTYTDKPAGLKRQFDKTLTKIENKIPFLSKTNEPYVDSSGKTQKNEGIFSSTMGDNFGSRMLDQMLSPGYYKKGKVTEEDKELNRLYKETGEDVYKNVSSGKVGDEKLSKKDFTKYQELYGSNTDKLYKAIINSDEYKKLDDAEKVKALKDAKATSKMIADHEIGGKQLKKSEQKTYDIYKEKGIDGLIGDFKESEKEKQEKVAKQAQKVEEAGGEKKYAEAEKKAEALDMSVDTYLKKEKEYKGGAEQYAEDHKEAKTYDLETDTYNKIVDKAGDNADKVLKAVPGLKRNGLGRANVYYQFADALKEIPSLTSGEFARQYNEINVDGSKGISQKELLTYLDNKGYDEKEANQMWSAYGGWTNKAGQKKKIKKGKDGKWTSYY